MTKNPNLDSFFEQVYAVARLVPKGRVTTYGAIAKYLGTARSARMVGWAMNGSFHVRPKVPAHRVVNRIGTIVYKKRFFFVVDIDYYRPVITHHNNMNCWYFDEDVQ